MALAEGRGRPTPLDAVTLLTLYLLALFLIESRLVIGPLGGAGNPAVLVSCIGFMWWCFHHAQRPVATGVGPEPLRTAMLAMFFAFTASFIAAMVRPISDLESSTAHLGMVTVLSWLGVGLLTLDGVPTFARLDQLVGRLVLLTTFLGVLGVAQFVTNDPLIRSSSIPGLTANIPLSDLGVRSGFTRPFGTALHPIEYGAVICMVLPLAISRAHGAAGAARWRWLPVALMSLGVVVSISRSALICATTALIVMALAWKPRARRIMAVSVIAGLAFVAIAVPGMLGSLRGLFVTVGEDNSVASRTGSYPLGFEFFQSSPFFGRGYSTFLPMYRIFDNQYLLLLVEVGLVGLVSVVALLVTGIRCARITRRLTLDPRLREQGQALAAGIAAASLGLAFYDGFSFPMATGVMFLLLGLIGAMHRLVKYGEVHERLLPTTSSSWQPPSGPHRP